MNVVPVGFGYTPKEVERVREGKVKVERREKVSFSLEHLGDVVSSIGHVDEMSDGRADDFLVLGSHEETGDADQLEFLERDDANGEESINEVGSDEQCLGEQAEFRVDLNQPVHDDATHVPVDLALIIHVVGFRLSLYLRRNQRGRP